MIFEYKREIETVTAYGKDYPVPTMTIGVLTAVNEVGKRIKSSINDLEGQTKAILDGIAIFIGEDEVKRIFPSVEAVDTDEVFAFWSALKSASDRNTKAVIEKYVPNAVIRKPNA